MLEFREIVLPLSPEVVAKVSELDTNLDVRWRTPKEELDLLMASNENAKFFVREGGSRVGYAVAVPLNSVFDRLKKFDRQMTPDSDAMFLESLPMKPDHNTQANVDEVITKLVEEAAKRDFSSLDLMISRKNDFSNHVQVQHNAVALRTIENYAGTGETFDYLRIRIQDGGAVATAGGPSSTALRAHATAATVPTAAASS